MHDLTKGKSNRLAAVLLLIIIMVFSIAATGSTAAWTSSGQSINNLRSQPLETKITAKNVSKLSPLFAVSTDGDVSATPNISGGMAYFPDWAGKLYAVDATTGAVRWKVSLSDYTGIPGTVSRSTPTSAGGGTLLVGTQRGAYLLAIDQRDGHLLWKVQVDAQPFAILTSSPTVHQGMAYIGVASIEEAVAADPDYDCCIFRGSAVAVDLNTHQVAWKTYTVPDNGGVPGGYSGNGVWGSQPVVDPARGSVYFGTGNNYTVPDCVTDGTCSNDPTNLIDAVLSLDMNTGAIKWVDRLMGLEADAWNVACFVPPGTNCPDHAGPDFDFGQAPMKLNVNINGKSVDILAIGQKSGTFWAIDPSTGQVLWSTVGGPGSSLGGMEWGSATDGTRIYYQVSNYYGIPYTLKDGTTATGGIWGAIDPATGQVLWQTAVPGGDYATGAVSVANGVVYAGSMGIPPLQIGAGQSVSKPTFFALDAATGKILWSYVSGGSVNSGAAIANGMVYWGAGYANQGLGDPVHKFFVFTVK